MSYTTISPQQLHELRAAGKAIDLIDVRSTMEYRLVHAEGAVLVPLQTVSPQSVQAARKGADGDPVYIICRSGGRSRMACERLVAAGMTNVVNVEGGTLAWEKAQLPVLRGPRPRWQSLARPVGIPVMLLFFVLAFTVNAYFLLAAIATWLVIVLAGGCLLSAMLFKCSCKTGCQTGQ